MAKEGVTLVPKQLEVVEKLEKSKERVDYIWADPGTGKTYMALEYYERWSKKLPRDDQSILVVIAPKIVLPMWEQEVRAWFEWLGLDMCRFDGSKPLGDPEKADVYIISWASLEKCLPILVENAWQEGLHWFIVFDESHFAKSKDAKRSKMAFGATFEGSDGYLGFASRALELTGTPIPSYWNDLWTQLKSGRAGLLMQYGVETYAKFTDKFCVVRELKVSKWTTRKAVVANKTNVVTKNLMKTILDKAGVIRVRLEEVADEMPKVTIRQIPVPVKYSKEAAKYLRGPKEGDWIELLKSRDEEDIALRNIARKYLGAAKAMSAVEYIKMLLETEPENNFLVGYYHKGAGDILCDAFKDDYAIARIDGDTKSAADEVTIDNFNAGAIKLLFGQTKALETGANLQGACHRIVLVEERSSPSEVSQFIARVARRGQPYPVLVDNLRCNDPLEQAVRTLRKDKTKSSEVL